MFRAAKTVLAATLKNYPSVFLPIAALREGPKKRLVRKTTDIVIEGYWRCGNHFAVYAFEVAQGGRVDIAHHFHAQAQLMLAARWGVPAVLLIREPLEAVASATVFLEQEDPRPLLRFYNLFHARLDDYVDRFVVSDFPVTVNDFGSVIAAVNEKFGRNFKTFQQHAGATCRSGSPDSRRARAEHGGRRQPRCRCPRPTRPGSRSRCLQRLARR